MFSPHDPSGASKRKHRRGNAVTVGLSLVTLLGCTALVVDVGYLLSANVELQASLDSAALAGVGYFDNTAAGVALARAKAVEFAAMNSAGGLPVVVPDEAIQVGIINEAREFVPSEDPTQIHAMSIDHTMVEVPAFFAPAAFGQATMQHNARSIARRFPGRGAGRVDCFLPLAVPDCVFDDPAATEALQFRMSSANNDNTAWADPNGNASANVVNNTLNGNCPVGGASVGDPVYLNNGELGSSFQTVRDILNDSGPDALPWDTARWGTQPARMSGSSVNAANYGNSVIEGPIMMFHAPPQPGVPCGSAVQFNGSRTITGFTYAVIYDVASQGNDKNLRVRLDLTNEYDMGTGGGGFDSNILSPGGGSLIR